MVIEEGALYVTTGSGEVQKLDSATGQVIWTYDLGGYTNNPPVVTSQAVLCLGSTGKLVSLNKETGEESWTRPDNDDSLWQLGDKQVKLPLILGCFGHEPSTQMIVAGGNNGEVFAISTEDGAIVWHKALGDKTVAPPIFDNGTVFIGTMDGRLHALDLESGADVWALPRIAAVSADGLITGEKPEEGSAEEPEVTYKLTVSTLYNFKPCDHLGDLKVEMSVLDAGGKPVPHTEGELVTIRGIVAKDHLGPRSHILKQSMELAAAPPQMHDWPIKVVLKDGSGAVIDELETSVSFLRRGEKKPPAPAEEAAAEEPAAGTEGDTEAEQAAAETEA
jgi:hypothetical protein